MPRPDQRTKLRGLHIQKLCRCRFAGVDRAGRLPQPFDQAPCLPFPKDHTLLVVRPGCSKVVKLWDGDTAERLYDALMFQAGSGPETCTALNVAPVRHRLRSAGRGHVFV